jgi:flagellar protein FlbT
MPLKIELKPGEKFIVNGAVIVAGRSGASLALKNKAVLLRGRDVMQEDEATTPARRLYFSLMLMYIDAERLDEHRAAFNRYLADYAAATTLALTRDKLRAIAEHADAGSFYAGLKLCRDLIALEDGILAGPPAPRAAIAAGGAR